jgi:hypothetical protein
VLASIPPPRSIGCATLMRRTPDNGTPITLVSATLGQADLKATSVYAHARPGESSGWYLKTKFKGSLFSE